MIRLRRRRCRHPRLERIGAVWAATGPPFPAVCPDCDEAIEWTTHRDPDGGLVETPGGLRVWAGPR